MVLGYSRSKCIYQGILVKDWHSDSCPEAKLSLEALLDHSSMAPPIVLP